MHKKALADDSGHWGRVVKVVKLSIVEFKEGVDVRHSDICHIGVDGQVDPLALNHDIGVLLEAMNLDHVSHFVGNRVQPLSLVGYWIFQKGSQYHRFEVITTIMLYHKIIT